MATNESKSKTVEITDTLEEFISDMFYEKVKKANANIQHSLSLHDGSLDSVKCHDCFDLVSEAMAIRKIALQWVATLQVTL